MSPPLALAYLFWVRHRLGLTLLGGYWLVLMIFCRAVPAGSFTLAPDGSLPPAAMVFVILCHGLIVALGYLLVIFSFGREARLEVCESGFPARLWPLPLRTRALAGWPMLWGSATMILGWLTLAWGARRPFGFDVPVIWPGLLLAVVLAWMQAIIWTPFPLPWLRAILLIPVNSFLFIPTAILEFGVPSVAACALLAALLSAAYWTAIRGVARARRGEDARWGWPACLRWTRTAMPTRQPFASAARAQLWFEWRRYGLFYPVAVFAGALFNLPMIPSLAAFLDDTDRAAVPFVPPLLLHELGSLWLVVAGLLILMSLLASVCGPEFGKLTGRHRTCPRSAFLTTRPVSVALLVRAKFEAAALSTLAGWAVLLLAMLLWFALGGHAAEMAGQFEAMRQRHAPGLFWGWLALLVGGAVVMTWLQIVQGLWMGLTGRATATASASAGFGIAVFLGLIVLGEWLPRYPEYWPAFGRLLPWLAGGAIVLKSLAAAWSLRALNRRALIPSGVLWGALGVWLLLAAAVFGALYALLPDDWFSAPGVILGIVLVLPLTRLALAPLTLDWNRHR